MVYLFSLSVGSTMFAGKEEEEVCVELGCLGKPLSAEKAAQPDKSKAGGEPVGFHVTSCSSSVHKTVKFCYDGV